MLHWLRASHYAVGCNASCSAFSSSRPSSRSSWGMVGMLWDVAGVARDAFGLVYWMKAGEPVRTMDAWSLKMAHAETSCAWVWVWVESKPSTETIFRVYETTGYLEGFLVWFYLNFILDPLKWLSHGISWRWIYTMASSLNWICSIYFTYCDILCI